jgi:hypothetical protein
MRFQVNDYQNKATMLRKAMTDAGHEIVGAYPDILFIDVDFPVSHYPAMIEKAYSEGGKIVLYSHGAPVITAWDGVYEPSDYVFSYLAQSPGQKAVMEMYGYPYPIDVIGWHYCQLKKFKPVKQVQNILFAPWHPHSNGWMIPEGKALNSAVFTRLLETPYHMTVRHVRALDSNGLWQAPGVEYAQSDMTIGSSIKAIDAADLVVTNYGTLASLAVARGKPLVVFGQDVCPHDGYSPSTLRYVRSWELYREYMRYPYDISALKPKAAVNLLEYAAVHEAADWRSKFIGSQFDAGGFVKLMEGIYGRDDD